jgi:hypothetical protein
MFRRKKHSCSDAANDDSASWFDVDGCREPLWCYQLVAVRYQLFDFLPVDSASIQPEPDPASWPNIGRHIELFWIRRNQRCIVSRQHLADEADYTVSVMIIQKVGKYLLPYIKRHMMSRNHSRGPGHAEADRSQSLEAVILWRNVFHSNPISRQGESLGGLRSRQRRFYPRPAVFP